MARRKRKEEVPEWRPPEFDEVEYMRREIQGAKTSVVTIAWAIVGALISYGLLFVGLHAALGFLAGLFAMAGLYYLLPFFGVRTKAFKRKDWAGHGVTYFFSWLAFWILLLNAPFSDFTGPMIHGFAVGSYDETANPGPGPGSVWCESPTTSSLAVTPEANNTTLLVLFRTSDNVGIANLEVRVNGNPASAESVGGQSHACVRNAGEAYPVDTYAVEIPIVGGTIFDVDIAASDAAGHRSASGVTLTVQA